MASDVQPLVIEDAETYRLAQEIATKTGDALEIAVRKSLQERLDKFDTSRMAKSLQDVLNEIALRSASLPIVDTRTANEILGYDKNGLP